MTSIEVMARIVQRQMDQVGLQIEKSGRNWDNGRVDLNHIHSRALVREIHGHNAHAEADAENILNVGGISAGQAGQHVSKRRLALPGGRVVGVLDEIVIEVEAAAALAAVQDL